MPISVTFPLALSTGSLGYLEPTSDIVSALESNVRQLLLTNWGERLMHPDFGCNFREFLFEQKTGALRTVIAERVKSQLGKWLPFLNLVGLFVTFSEEDTAIPDPGFQIELQLTYGNIPINLFLMFPQN
ncbi:MAG TPA: GPW/gp25 family protein [Isosphaeraceae bacterium]|nr:GPW/gp25 family protein [Isosphaeraceae bacterium]